MPQIRLILLLLLMFIETHAQSSKPPPPQPRSGGFEDDVNDEAALPINGYLTFGLLAGALYGYRILNGKRKEI